MKHYQVKTNELATVYTTDVHFGLSSEEAASRLQKQGLNSLVLYKKNIVTLFFDEIKNPFLSILLVAGFFALLHGDLLDAIAISAITLFNALLGTVQEYKAQKILDVLSQRLDGSYRVVRDGQQIFISAQFLVVGDIVTLSAGERVPADMRIITTQGFVEVSEALLSGESQPVVKEVRDIVKELPIFEQSNMLFMGTYIIRGYVTAVVVATGSATESGALGITAQTLMRDSQLPFQKELSLFVRHILQGVGLLGMFLGYVAWFHGTSLYEMLLFSSTLIVCMIPEGLPVVVTVLLAFGARRLAGHGILVRKLAAVEALGRIDVLVFDKTGTLTHNQMMVSHVWSNGAFYTVTGVGYAPQGTIVGESAYEKNILFNVLVNTCYALNTAHCTVAATGEIDTLEGDETEAALGVFAAKAHLETLWNHQVYDMPFSSEYRLRLGIFESDTQLYVVFFGAPEVMQEWLYERTLEYESALAQFLHKGLRVLVSAWYSCPKKTIQNYSFFLENEVKKHAQCTGVIGLEDPIRQEVAPLVLQARHAGLSLVMATGDHRATAAYVAQKTEILLPGDRIDEGADILGHEYDERVTVFARVTPQDKLSLINLLHAAGKRVAMTGDGVNDVLSLVAADVGIAMGKGGTDVARDAADIVLVDNSFSALIHAIQEGRMLLTTLRRIILYLLTTNMSELLFVFTALVMGFSLPLMPIHIVWFNFVTHGFFDVALAQEIEQSNVLESSWLSSSGKQGLFNSALFLKIVGLSVSCSVYALWIFWYFYTDIAVARTAAVTVLACMQWVNAWNCRWQDASLFIARPLNYWLIAATCCVALLHCLLLYIPFLADSFKMVALTGQQWLFILPCICVQLLVGELVKAISARV